MNEISSILNKENKVSFIHKKYCDQSFTIQWKKSVFLNFILV